MEENKVKSTGKTLTIIILSILLVLSLGYIGYDKFLIKETTNTETKNTKKINNEAKENTTTDNNDEENNSESVQKSKCSGTYYGEYSETSGQLTSDFKYTYVLNEDGTFTSDFSGVSGTKGVYTINDNTISFTGKDEITGPREEDPYYSTSDYVIADDCSYIIYNNGITKFKLNRR